MQRNQAAALIMYLQKAYAVVPTTGAEWEMVQGATKFVEGVASGQITLNPPDPPKAEETPKGDEQQQNGLDHSGKQPAIN